MAVPARSVARAAFWVASIALVLAVVTWGVDRVYVRPNEHTGINHAVLFGKNADGTRYIYNPLGDPPYLSEKKGDSKSSAALDKMAASLMAQKGFGTVTDDYHSQVTTY